MKDFAFPLTGVENAAIHAAEELGRLESLVLDLEVQNAQLRSQRDALARENQSQRERIAQMAPVQDIAEALDRINNFLCGESLKIETRLANIETKLSV